jgi:DinB superfamily
MEGMTTSLSTVAGLAAQFREIRIDAATLTGGIPEVVGTWRAQPASWSIAECFEHLALFNRTYVAAMKNGLHGVEPAEQTQESARPGLWGRMFVRSMEPPVKSYTKSRAAAIVAPRGGVSLEAASAAFFASYDEVEALLEASRTFSLERIRFVNPFFKRLRPSLATGFHIIAVHERRHLWQASVLRDQAKERPQPPGQTYTSDYAGLGSSR